jgi:formyltetrahydrofolate deformylase
MSSDTQPEVQSKAHPHQLVLTVACPSAAGQVAAVVGFLDRHNYYVDELTVFDDDLSHRFFVRCVFHGVDRDETLQIAALQQEFAPIAERFSMTWAIHNVDARPKVLIMVSKLEHCLADLLFRWRMGATSLVHGYSSACPTCCMKWRMPGSPPASV